MDFVRIALLEINDYLESIIRYNAISHRIAKADDETFKDFLTDESKFNHKNNNTTKIIDHEEQMRRAMEI